MTNIFGYFVLSFCTMTYTYSMFGVLQRQKRQVRRVNCEEHRLGRPYTVDSSASGRIHLAGSYVMSRKSFGG
jgi:hypothetical protein